MSEWICCSDRLPDKHGFYKVITKSFENYEDFKAGKHSIKEEVLKFEGGMGSVTHWMPLPEPPQELYE